MLCFQVGTEVGHLVTTSSSPKAATASIAIGRATVTIRVAVAAPARVAVATAPVSTRRFSPIQQYRSLDVNRKQMREGGIALIKGDGRQSRHLATRNFSL